MAITYAQPNPFALSGPTTMSAPKGNELVDNKTRQYDASGKEIINPNAGILPRIGNSISDIYNSFGNYVNNTQQGMIPNAIDSASNYLFGTPQLANPQLANRVTPGSVSSIISSNQQIGQDPNKAVGQINGRSYNYAGQFINSSQSPVKSTVNTSINTGIPTPIVPPPTISGSTMAVPNYVAPAITADEQRVLDAQKIQEQTNQVLDPETLYQQKLARQQQEIDMQNNIYNDMINQSRINNAAKYKGRIESRQFAQGRAGQIGSGTGEAGINAVQDANTQEQNANEALINEQRNQKIASIQGIIRQSAEAEAIANKEARMKGADAIVSNAALRATTRAKTAANAIKGLLAAGVDLQNMTEAEKKTYLDGIGISSTDWNAIVGTETSAVNTAKKEADKAAAELEKTKAETSNLLGKNDFEAAQKALDRQLEEKKINVQWYNAESSRISALKKDSNTADKNYDEKTIPTTIKSTLLQDVKNANSVEELMAAYPSVNSTYITDLYNQLN